MAFEVNREGRRVVDDRDKAMAIDGRWLGARWRHVVKPQRMAMVVGSCLMSTAQCPMSRNTSLTIAEHEPHPYRHFRLVQPIPQPAQQ